MNNDYNNGALPSLKDAVWIGAITTAVSVLLYQLGLKDMLLIVVTMLINAALLGNRTGIPNGGKMAALYSVPLAIGAYLLTQGPKTSVSTIQVILDSLYGSSYGLALGIALGLLFKRKARVFSLAIAGIAGFFLASILFYATQFMPIDLGVLALLFYNVVGCTVMLKGAAFIEESIVKKIEEK